MRIMYVYISFVFFTRNFYSLWCLFPTKGEIDCPISSLNLPRIFFIENMDNNSNSLNPEEEEKRKTVDLLLLILWNCFRCSRKIFKEVKGKEVKTRMQMIILVFSFYTNFILFYMSCILLVFLLSFFFQQLREM